MNTKIEIIKTSLRTRDYQQVRTLLDNLEKDLNKTEKLQEFFDKVKRLCREMGKSNMINKEEINQLIKGVKE